MSEPQALKIDGLVSRPTEFSREDLARLPAAQQIADVSRIDPKRRGVAVTLAGLLEEVGALPAATFLGLHAAKDDFHASVPLSAVRERGIVIYELDGQSLDTQAGGPFRFYIRDFASCKTDDIDECANVKFVDRIELTAERGFDNRPTDEAEHAALHEKEEH